MLQPGMILGNRYEIVEKIGAGGMSIVYKARCRKLERFVAVKVLRDELVSDEEFVSRFKIEAQAAASLSHPNIVNVYDVGTEDQIYYIVMEYIKGTTLKEKISMKAPFPSGKTLEIAMKIASALQHAHRNHIVHRDIKPQNIIVTEDGIVKVADFGIARAVTSSTVSVTASAIGSVHYFSPEQARGGYVDEKSDLYSLGVVMYEMATGKMPFEGDSSVSVALKHIQDEFPIPSEISPEISQSLEKIILKAVQKRPELRYQNVDEMLSDMETALQNPNGDFIKAVDVDSSPTVKMSPDEIRKIRQDAQNTFEEEEEKNPKKERWIVVGAVLTALVIIAAITAVGMNYLTEYLKPKEIEVPAFIGLTWEQAESMAEEAQLLIEKNTEQYHDAVEEGKIFKQDADPGVMVKIGATIYLDISKGMELFEVPMVENLEYNVAQVDIQNQNLMPDTQYDYSDSVPVGIIISQEPKEGTMLPKGETVTILVSRGPEIKMVKIPNVIGDTEAVAREKLRQAGLVPGTTTQLESEVEKGRVIRQSVNAGEEKRENYVVDLIISKGKPQPKVVRRTIAPILSEDQETVLVQLIMLVGTETKEIINEERSIDQFPFEVEITGEGEAELLLYIDGDIQWRDSISFEVGS